MPRHALSPFSFAALTPVADGPARHRARSAPATAIQSPLARIAALVLVAVLGVSVVSAAAGPAGAAGGVLRARVAAAWAARPHVAGAWALRPHVPAFGHGGASRHAAAGSHTGRGTSRWLPSGTGMWTFQWDRTQHGNAAAVVRRARRIGLSTLYVRSGGDGEGFSGAPALRHLLPLAHRAGIHVVAWDFPTLRHPVRDAHRLARAAWYAPRGQHVDAVAPDIETAAEGTRLTSFRVRRYLRSLRNRLPHRVAILATVPWPSSERVGRYPYRLVAAHADALIPMAYWYNNSPTRVTRTSIRYLRHYRKPVLPVGQGYDGRIDAPWLPPSHPRRELAGFFGTARAAHVRAVSLWDWQTAGREQWGALDRARHAFGRR